MSQLEGIRLKTERAKTIINNLDRCLRKFAQRKPYRVRVDEHLDKDGSIIGNLTAVKNPKCIPSAAMRHIEPVVLETV